VREERRERRERREQKGYHLKTRVGIPLALVVKTHAGTCAMVKIRTISREKRVESREQRAESRGEAS
jgi:hypothetical protein